MNDLSKLPNIGKILANKLEEVGIHNAQELKRVGAENTFLKISTIDNEACINMLYALEGAIQGIRWHSLNKERKLALNQFFQMLNK
jgi:DNA transformation protein and related proteins